MNLVIDQSKFLQQLGNVPACNPIEAAGHDGEVNTYLMEHVLQPMQGERLPTIGELDFSAFDADELAEFGRYIRNASQMSGQIASWCATFHSIEPIAQTQRAYC